MRNVRIVAISLLLLIPSMAHAVDGVIEISQACATGPGCFTGDAGGFPVTISTGSSHVLTSNLVVADKATNAIEFTTSDATLDLNGFEIRGNITCENTDPDSCSPAGTGLGISGGSSDRITVKGGRVRGFGGGGILLGDEAIVHDVYVNWNLGHGLEVGFRSKVSRSTAITNVGIGIHVDPGSTVSDCTASANGDRGIYGFGGPHLIERNIVRDNGAVGIFTHGAATVVGNMVSSNDSSGIITSGASVPHAPSTIAGNTSNANGGDGIRAGRGSAVLGNTVADNSSHGINCAGQNPASVTGACLVKGNSAYSNGGYGLHLDTLIGAPFDSAYRENTMIGNGSGGVDTGVNLGANYCEGTGVTLASCP